MKWTDKFENMNVRKVPQPAIISKFLKYSNSVDNHNHLRQACLKLEKKWVTPVCWFCLFTTHLGINVVDMFCLAKFCNLLPTNRINLVLDRDVNYDGKNEYLTKKFAGIFSMQLLYKVYNLQQNMTGTKPVYPYPNDPSSKPIETTTTSKNNDKPKKKYFGYNSDYEDVVCNTKNQIAKLQQKEKKEKAKNMIH